MPFVEISEPTLYYELTGPAGKPIILQLGGVGQIRRPILFTNSTLDKASPPRLAKSGFSDQDIVNAVPEYATLLEFPDIGHAPLLEATEEAVQVVTDFFLEALVRERQPATAGQAT